MKELLIVKSGERYLRFLPDGYEFCKMDKASVFPLDQVTHVRELCRLITENSTEKLALHKLTIIEEPYSEDK